jgi:hypothetical protein
MQVFKTNNMKKFSINKIWGRMLCMIGIHKRDELVEDEYVIGIGCPRCETIYPPIRWKNDIPPPRMKGETDEQYALAVKEYQSFRDSEDELFREAVRGACNHY